MKFNVKICLALIFILIYYCLTIVFIKKNFFLNIKSIELSSNLTPNDIINLKKGQQIMTDMLRDFDRICRKYNIEYWCIGGTLIGTIRHNGWVPWDGDIDLGMLKTDYLKFKNIINNEIPSNMVFSEPSNKPCKKLRSNRAKYIYTKWGINWDLNEGIQIDIFVFKNDNKYIYGHAPICGRPDKNKRIFNDIYPLKELYFEDIKVYVPNEYEKISQELWGGFPPLMIEKNKRFPHEGRIYIIENNTKIKGNSEVYDSNDSFYPNKKISLYKKKIFLKLLKYGDIFFQENDIKYSIAYGTLLGFFRNKKFIPYDHDLDCFIGIESFNKLLKLGYDTKNKRVIFNDEIIKYKPDFKSDNIYLILNKSLLENRGYGKRYSCKGNILKQQIDRCSFRGIIGRFIVKKTEYDIFSYNTKFEELKTHKFYPDNHNSISKMDFVERDTLENVSISVLKKKKALTFLKTRYGNNFIIPNK